MNIWIRLWFHLTHILNFIFKFSKNNNLSSRSKRNTYLRQLSKTCRCISITTLLCCEYIPSPWLAHTIISTIISNFSCHMLRFMIFSYTFFIFPKLHVEATKVVDTLLLNNTNETLAALQNFQDLGLYLHK